MSKGEAERALRAAGFMLVRTGRHAVWQCRGVRVSLHMGTRCDPRQTKHVKLALKRAAQQGGC